MAKATVYYGRIALVVAAVSGAVAYDLVYRGLQRLPTEPVWEVADGDPQAGRQAIARYGCGGCHVIPGLRHATGRVGPQLVDFQSQLYIAGVLPNTPDHLIDWIRNPQDVDPQTAMPNLGVTDQEARDIAAYLYGAR